MAVLKPLLKEGSAGGKVLPWACCALSRYLRAHLKFLMPLLLCGIVSTAVLLV
uniref:Uncharacterized protein n=1 Tax=Peronospora matthiolae TaxID=2874970 RepID=A0AAV1T9L1_9STRA